MSYFVSITTGAAFRDGDADGEVSVINKLAALEDVVRAKTNMSPSLGGGRIEHTEIAHDGWSVDGTEKTKQVPRLGYFVSTMAEAYAIVNAAPFGTHSIVAYLDRESQAGEPMPSRFVAGTGKWSVPATLTTRGESIPTGHLPVFRLEMGNNPAVLSVDV